MRTRQKKPPRKSRASRNEGAIGPRGSRASKERREEPPAAHRRAVGAALLALSSRQEAILAAVPDIIMEVDCHKVYTWANQAGLAFFGADVVGKEAAFYFEGEQATYQLVEPLFGGHQDVICVESWQRRKDGERRLLAWWCRVLKDETGNVTGALSAARDITDQKRAEDALRESEQRLESIVETTPAGITMLDRDGRITYANAAAEQILGLTRSDITARVYNDPGWKITAADGTPFPDEQLPFVRVMQSNQPVHGVEHAIVHRDGRRAILSVNAAPLRDAAGLPVGMVTTITDITEHMRTEEALRNSASMLNEMGRIAEIGGWEMDLITRQARWTKGTYDIVEIGYGDPVPGPDEHVSYYLPEHRPMVEGAMKRLIEEDIPLDFEAKLRTAKGHIKWCRALGKAGRKDGVCIKVYGTFQNITERKQAEEALRESERRYQTLAEVSPVGIFRTDAQGQTTYVNPRWCQISGLSAAAALGQGWLRAVHPEDRAKLAQGWQVAAEAQRTSIAEYRFVHTDGTLAWVMGQAVPEKNQAGRIIGYVGTITDITERRQAEAALKQEQTLFNSLVSTIPDHIYFKDRQSRFVRINASMAQHFGLRDPAEAVGKTDFDMFSEEHARQAYEDEQRILATGEPIIGLEEKETWPDGHITWVSTTKVPRRDATGNIIGLVGISRDITERKQAAERIREQAALLDQANDAIYVTTLDCTILYWNRAAEQIYGWSAAEAVGRKTSEFVSAGDPKGGDLLAAVIQKEDWSGERQQMTKAGGRVEVMSRLTLLRDDQGQPRSILVINTDITAKKELEARFLRAQRLESIGALASGIAHDLNNVLAPIIMGAPLLRDSAKDETARSLLGLIEASAQRGADIVRQVLTFARGTEGQRVSLQPEYLVRDVARLINETFPKNIQVEDESTAGVWPVEVDATQLQQALMNLCINARDAMPDGGKLTLAVANTTVDKALAAKSLGGKPGPHVCLRVTDTGTGIPPEIAERIFEPFFTTKGLGKGTGLGLSTVRGIARSHGGFVRLDSEVGQGTTFELYLPALPSALALAPPGSEPPWPHGAGERVLLVDDEAAVREVARQALKEFGYQVTICAAGADAVRVFQDSHRDIDLVVTDMMMPEMDGPALVSALRAIDPRVRILGITGVSDAAAMSRLRTLTFSAPLAKPFTIGELLTAVHEAMRTAAPRK
jgi:PAS domain S-box-containing protein